MTVIPSTAIIVAAAAGVDPNDQRVASDLQSADDPQSGRIASGPAPGRGKGDGVRKVEAGVGIRGRKNIS
jgi:hypothetical protein